MAQNTEVELKVNLPVEMGFRGDHSTFRHMTQRLTHGQILEKYRDLNLFINFFELIILAERGFYGAPIPQNNIFKN